MAEDYDWSNYETGPFCRHWFDPSDCRDDCAYCGHRCPEHEIGHTTECAECDCPEYKDPDEAPGAVLDKEVGDG